MKQYFRNRSEIGKIYIKPSDIKFRCIAYIKFIFRCDFSKYCRILEDDLGRERLLFCGGRRIFLVVRRVSELFYLLLVNQPQSYS